MLGITQLQLAAMVIYFLQLFMRNTMQLMYAKNWFNIQFQDCLPISSKQLADGKFYELFYIEFFKRYQRYDDLDAKWRDSKRNLANYIINIIGSRNLSLLSIGCGIGYVEKHIHDTIGSQLLFDIHDIAAPALRWIKNEIDHKNIYVGEIDVLEDKCYDLIYLSAVDSAINDQDLIDLMRKLSDKLNDGGQLIIFSAAFSNELSQMQRIILKLKESIKFFLEHLNLYHRGQFWGWIRNREEYWKLLIKAGFKKPNISDGFVPNGQEYWIAGQKVTKSY